MDSNNPVTTQSEKLQKSTDVSKVQRRVPRIQRHPGWICRTNRCDNLDDLTVKESSGGAMSVQRFPDRCLFPFHIYSLDYCAR